MKPRSHLCLPSPSIVGSPPKLLVLRALLVSFALISAGLTAAPVITNFQMLDRVTQQMTTSGVAVSGQMIRFYIAAHCPDCCDHNVECTVDAYKGGVFIGTIACGSPGIYGWAAMDGSTNVPGDLEMRPWARCYETEEFTEGTQRLSVTVLSSLTVAEVGNVENPSAYSATPPATGYHPGHISLNDVRNVKTTMSGMTTGVFTGMVDWHVESVRSEGSPEVEVSELDKNNDNTTVNPLTALAPGVASSFPDTNDAWGDGYTITASIGERPGQADEVNLTNTGGVTSSVTALTLFFNHSSYAFDKDPDKPNWFFYWCQVLGGEEAIEDDLSGDGVSVDLRYCTEVDAQTLQTAADDYFPVACMITLPEDPPSSIPCQDAVLGPLCNTWGFVECYPPYDPQTGIMPAPAYRGSLNTFTFMVSVLHWHAAHRRHNYTVHGDAFTLPSAVDSDKDAQNADAPDGLCHSASCIDPGGWEGFWHTDPTKESTDRDDPYYYPHLSGWAVDTKQVAVGQGSLTDYTPWDWASDGLQWEDEDD